MSGSENRDRRLSWGCLQYLHQSFVFFATIRADIQVLLNQRHHLGNIFTPQRRLGELIDQFEHLVAIKFYILRMV